MLYFKGKIIGIKQANRDWKKPTGESGTIERSAIGVQYESVNEWGEIENKTRRIYISAKDVNAEFTNHIAQLKGKEVEITLYQNVSFGEFYLDPRFAIKELGLKEVKSPTRLEA